MVYELFTRKRSPESSTSEPPRKWQSRGLRASSVANHGSWLLENASRRTSHHPLEDGRRSERDFARNDFERRPSSSEARMNPFLPSPPRKPEEDLEPPGTGSSTLQYTLTPRVSFMTWKDRLYRELEELNCLFTVEPTMRKKANMALEDELTYRSLAKAIICMRLDDAHLALVSKIDDPLKVMKVLADFREPELRHLEKRAQERLNATVYHTAVPVRDFIRTFENLLREVEKYSGERMSDKTMKQHLLSSIVGDFPNIMVGSKTSSNDIHYDDLKKLLIEESERRAAANNAKLEQRHVAGKNIRATEPRNTAASIASQKVQVSEKHPANKTVDVKAQRNVRADEQCNTSTNAAVSQGLVSRIGTSQIVEVNDRRPIGLNAASRNAELKERQPSGSNAVNSNAVAKEQGFVPKDERPAVKSSDESRVPVKTAQGNEPGSAGATVTNKSFVENKRHPITSHPVDKQPRADTDLKATEQRASPKSLKDEPPLSAKDDTASNNRSIANSGVDERPLSVKDVKANERRSDAKSYTDERPLHSRDAGTNERRPGVNASDRNAVVEDPRPLGTGAVLDEQRSASKNSVANQRRPASFAPGAIGKNTDADERYPSAKSSRLNERCDANSNAAGKSDALYERRAPKPSTVPPKDELKEQLELDRQIQELIEINPRLASKESSCTKCGAYGHVVGDCKRKDNRRKCYSCLDFVDDHVASSCPYWDECAAMPKFSSAQTNRKSTLESHESRSIAAAKPSLSSPPFEHSRYFADNRKSSAPPGISEDYGDEDDDDDIPLIDGLRQVYHIRRRMTTKKLKTGRTARKDLIFTDSDFYTDVEYREMFIEEGEEEPGDIILETIKVMSTGQK